MLELLFNANYLIFGMNYILYKTEHSQGTEGFTMKSQSFSCAPPATHFYCPVAAISFLCVLSDILNVTDTYLKGANYTCTSVSCSFI